ncbi:MAG: helix-turn-helix transcriptional regulator [Clostridia bacterium]|nr:helix-turn-helix transcriptional regulator [Clostridia bacterium]MBP3588082.1 helix-turn-helix transcriptional regulator [Clostridia bacterium]
MLASGNAIWANLWMLLLIAIPWAVRIFIVVLLIKALLKYLNDKKATPEQAVIRRSLGEALKAHRQNCGMTQEYVAEALGVSRQAVSKWETGAAEPSTSNLLALAKLYGVDPGELLRGVQ